jgi:hypothetical protein
MSKVPQRDEERDQQLITDYQAKKEDGSWSLSVTQIASIHGVSPARVYQVLDHYKITRRSSDVRQHAKRS